jgi:hypothetical protein
LSSTCVSFNPPTTLPKRWLGQDFVALEHTHFGPRVEIDVWAEPCSVGANLPTMPLRLTGDLFVPVEFEATYQETCRQRRLIG